LRWNVLFGIQPVTSSPSRGLVATAGRHSFRTMRLP
jgi:hypothetical protein